MSRRKCNSEFMLVGPRDTDFGIILGFKLKCMEWKGHRGDHAVYGCNWPFTKSNDEGKDDEDKGTRVLILWENKEKPE